MNLTQLAAPQGALIALATARAHLRVTHTGEDALIALYARAATARFDGRDGITGRSLITQSWRLTLDAFPDRNGGAIVLPLPPLQTVDAVKYDDANGDEQTLAASAYTIRTSYGLSRIVPVTAWPNATAVRVDFTAGYGNAGTDVPAPIVAAALLQLTALYEARGSIGQNVTFSTNPTEAALLAPYRVREQW